jgi:protein-tyrosine phosphatase
MAEYLLQQKLRQAGMRAVTVTSAGVFAVEGMSPTRETQQLLQKIGADCSSHRAQSLTLEMVMAADLVLVMEHYHEEEIVRRFPSAKGKVQLLKTYGQPTEPLAQNPNIPDPIGKPMEVYEVCFETIREAVERLAKALGLRRGGVSDGV